MVEIYFGSPGFENFNSQLEILEVRFLRSSRSVATYPSGSEGSNLLQLSGSPNFRDFKSQNFLPPELMVY
jgi:hypothetical protein